jgi:Tol biopolymer transport system component
MWLVLLFMLCLLMSACGDGGSDIVSPTTGTLEISTATTGETSSGGYTVSIDGGASEPIGLNATLRRSEVTEGAHAVQLAGLAAGCSVAGDNPRTVMVTPGATTTVAFAINCVPPVGTIRVLTATTGPAPASYDLLMDGTSLGSIGSATTRMLEGVSLGAHSIGLAGLPANCQLAGDNPRGVIVTLGSTVDVSFSVACTLPPAETGSLNIGIATTGSNLDPDGYTVALDGGPTQPIGTNASLTLSGIPAGPHSVSLGGIAGNCTLDGNNPRTANVVAGQTTSIIFAVGCTTPAPPIAFTSNGPGLLAVFLVNPDGTGLQKLTDGSNPVWSPDRRRILFVDNDFVGNDGLMVINADGSGRTELVTGEYFVSQYRWSPSGRMIAVVISRLVGEDVFDDLWVMESDGSNRRRLAVNANSPTWAATSGRLAYVDITSASDVHLRVIKLDGSESRRLTSPGILAFQPAWSPMDARIAFVTVGDKDLFLIDPDGTGLTNLTGGQADDDGPTWSPDGSKIAFTTELPGQSGSEIAVMDSDGGNRRILTGRPGFDLSPGWSPEGSSIVFHGSEPGDSEIFVMNADGTGIRNVSNRPTTLESTPNWAGGGIGASLRAAAIALRMRLSQ